MYRAVQRLLPFRHRSASARGRRVSGLGTLYQSFRKPSLFCKTFSFLHSASQQPRQGAPSIAVVVLLLFLLPPLLIRLFSAAVVVVVVAVAAVVIVVETVGAVFVVRVLVISLNLASGAGGDVVVVVVH